MRLKYAKAEQRTCSWLNALESSFEDFFGNLWVNGKREYALAMSQRCG